METVNIDINREYIYEYVTTLTGTLGKQKNDYDRYVCLPDNYTVLDRFMDTAIAVIEASLWRKLSNSYSTTLKYSNSNLAISINNKSFPDKLKGLLYTNTRLALAYILSAMWLQGIEPEYYKVYAGLADGYIDKISVISAQHETKDAIYEDGNADDVQDTRDNTTGNTALQDNIDTNATNRNRTDVELSDNHDNGIQSGRCGEQPIRDCHTNKHSGFDHATYHTDGTVLSF